jgi:hypothetical protein
MSHVTLTDVEWINLNVLVVIRAGLQYDMASTCCRYGLNTEQANYLRSLSLDESVVPGDPRRRHDPVPATRRPGDAPERPAAAGRPHGTRPSTQALGRPAVGTSPSMPTRGDRHLRAMQLAKQLAALGARLKTIHLITGIPPRQVQSLFFPDPDPSPWTRPRFGRVVPRRQPHSA